MENNVVYELMNNYTIEMRNCDTLLERAWNIVDNPDIYNNMEYHLQS